MIEIKLTRGYVAIVDDCDSDLAEMKWSADKHGYAYRNVYVDKNHFVYVNMHRLIMSRVTGIHISELPKIDHKNNTPWDNRRENLRLATNLENGRNKKLPSNNKSGYKGVTKRTHSNTWQATIKVNGIAHYLGNFPTPELASEAYKAAAVKYFGEFARFE